MSARTATSPWSPALAPGNRCPHCDSFTPYDETRVVGTLHLHSWHDCDCRVRGKRILTIQRSGPAFTQPPPLLLAAVAGPAVDRLAALTASERLDGAVSVNGTKTSTDNPQRYDMPIWERRQRLKVSQHNSRASVRGLLATLTYQEWMFACSYFDNSCAYCGRKPVDWTMLCVEHVIRLDSSDCPGTIAENVVPACSRCNLSKGPRDVYEWLRKKQGQDEAVRILVHIEEYSATALYKAIAAGSKPAPIIRPTGPIQGRKCANPHCNRELVLGQNRRAETVAQFNRRMYCSYRCGANVQKYAPVIAAIKASAAP